MNNTINLHTFTFPVKIKKNKSSWSRFVVPSKKKKKENVSGQIDKILYR